jgi:hypothetical protein
MKKGAELISHLVVQRLAEKGSETISHHLTKSLARYLREIGSDPFSPAKYLNPFSPPVAKPTIFN